MSLRTSLRIALLSCLTCVVVGAFGCSERGGTTERDASFGDVFFEPGDAARSFGDSSFGTGELSILRVAPDHGPFTGGTTSVLRGTGYDDESQVTFGEHAVQPADHTLVDSRRLQVVVPAGDVGTVDVTVQVGDATFTLPDAYTYDALALDPTSGSISGGTFVTILGSGTGFVDGDRVLFGRSECTDVTVVSATRITCRTPPLSAGTVDVSVVRAEDGTTTTAVGAYTYYDSSDPYSGGLGGGPITGSINVTVIDAYTGLYVPDAFAILGEDLATEHQGFTDVMGGVTFSGPDLMGQQTIHVSKHCYERTSFVAFDAQDVTVFLTPWLDPACGMGSGGGGSSRGRNGSFIEGELIWRGPNEYGPNPWDNIPAERTGWNRAAYVFTTRLRVSSTNPDPSAGGGTNRVIEQVTASSVLGYPYRIYARPAGLAVYALAGLENPSTGQFVPYVMGVARNVLAGPGETVPGVDIVMDIPLDHYVEVELGAQPAAVAGGPDRYRFEATLDLGGEGVIVRAWDAFNFDVFRRYSVSDAVRFLPEPALQGTLSDGRYRIAAGWYTTEWDQPPYTRVLQTGVTAVDDVVQLPDFLGIPEATAPTDGSPIPTDRVLRWEPSAGGIEPDFQLLLLTGGDGNPAWRIFLPGNVNEAPIPDLSAIPDLDDLAPGTLYWVLYAVKVPGFDFDEFRYTYLSDAYWSHAALNQFVATF